MIKRIASINKVGLFDNYAHTSDCDFGRVTLIYGENGVGKSTLSAILDSLRENNPIEIIRRKKIPGDADSSVVIELNEVNYSFQREMWDGKPPDNTIDVFFPGFVNRNVHAAISIDTDQKRNLCELVFGRSAVEKVARLSEVDKEGRTALAQKNDIDKKIVLLIKKPGTIDTFLGLANDPKIDERLEQIRLDLKQAEGKEATLRKTVPEKVTLPATNLDSIVLFLEKSTGDFDSAVTTIIQEHITRHLDEEGEGWLEYGSRHLTAENKCPFCAQDITKSSLVANIRNYFSVEYRAYIESLLSELKKIWESFGFEVFSRVREAISTQVAVAAQWSDGIEFNQPAVVTILNEAEKIWKSALGKLETVVSKKQFMPLEKLGPELADQAFGEYQASITLLEKVNEMLSECGKKAEEIKAKLSKADTAIIGQQLNQLENQKLRFEPIALDLISKRSSYLETRTRLEAEKLALKKEIDENASRVLGKYQASINYYLEYFGCDIRIESIEQMFPSGKASVEYALNIHGHKIEHGVSETEPSFETVLSEGDKYTLALSFFFARLKGFDDLTGRVVVLDDPVNTLGSSRRVLVTSILRDLHARGAQIVVLTHDDLLAAKIWMDKVLHSHVVPLQVERTTLGSKIKPWDAESAIRSEYVSHYLSLEDYLKNGGDHKKPAGCIRPYLEQRLRHLFPGPPFETRHNLGQMIRIIRESGADSRLFSLKEKLPDLEAINEAALPSHHASDDVPGMETPTPESVRLFAEKALKM